MCVYHKKNFIVCKHCLTFKGLGRLLKEAMRSHKMKIYYL